MMNSSPHGERRLLIVSDAAGFIPKADFHREHPVKKVRKPAQYKKAKRSTDRLQGTRRPDQLGGEFMWRCLRERNVVPMRNQPGFPSFKRTSIPDGMLRAEREQYRLEAMAKARLYMKELIDLMNDDDNAYKATEALLAIGLDPASPVKERVQALKTVLEMCKAKPVAPRLLIGDPNNVLTTTSSIISLLEDDTNRLLNGDDE